MKLSRRQFLKQASATGALFIAPSLMIGCSKENATAAKVVVIGAGLAGLNCAKILTEQGYEPVILEANTQAGGRTLSVQVDDDIFNMGGIEIGDGYARFVSLAKELKLDLFEPPKAVSGLSIFNAGQLIDAKDWEQSVGNLLPEGYKSTVPSRLQSSLHFKDFPFKSLQDWFDPKFAHLDIPESQRLRSLGADDEVLKLINRTGNFNDIDQVSSLHVMRALAGYRYGASKKTLRLSGGNDALALAMAEQLPKVHYQHEVKRVSQTKQGLKVECANGAVWNAEKVVLAVPFSVARRIQFDVELPALHRQAINELPYTRITKLMARVEKPFWEQDGLPPSMWCNGPLERCFLSKNRQGEFFYTAFINGVGTEVVDAMSETDAREWIMQQIASVRPAAVGTLKPVAYHSWGNDPYALGAYAAFAPGQITAFAQEMLKPAGNLYFAGEHCARSSSGMEGALESGEYTALQMLAA